MDTAPLNRQRNINSNYGNRKCDKLPSIIIIHGHVMMYRFVEKLQKHDFVAKAKPTHLGLFVYVLMLNVETVT